MMFVYTKSYRGTQSLAMNCQDFPYPSSILWGFLLHPGIQGIMTVASHVLSPDSTDWHVNQNAPVPHHLRTHTGRGGCSVAVQA